MDEEFAAALFRSGRGAAGRSHRERVEAGMELQASRRRRRASLEISDLERAGYRAGPGQGDLELAGYRVVQGAPVADQSEMDAYLSSFQSASIRRRSLDSPQMVTDAAAAAAAAAALSARDNCSSVLAAAGSRTNPLSDRSGAVRTVSVRPQPSALAMMCRASAELTITESGSNSYQAGNLRVVTKQQGPEAVPKAVVQGKAIPDAWAGDGKLAEWVDWSAVDSALRPPELKQAQASLIANSRTNTFRVATSVKEGSR